MSDVASPEAAVAAEIEPKPSKKFTKNFWTINVIEMGERLAYNTLRAMVAIYIAQADEPGGLHLTQVDRGTILAVWAFIQSFLPIVTGGLADRFGYRRSLAWALSTMTLGYICLAFMRDLNWLTTFFENYTLNIDDFGGNAVRLHQAAVDRSNFWSFMIAVGVLAGGTSLFKPAIQGALGNTLTKENSSVGWGVFYWVVNVGAFIGHYLPNLILVGAAGWLAIGEHSAEAWRNLFLVCAGVIVLNLVALFFMKDVESGASKTESILSVLWRTITNILEPRLLSWIIIMTGFWMMMMQLWDMQPNFIADWMNSAHIATWVQDTFPSAISKMLVSGSGEKAHIPQQIWLSINSLCIIIGVVPMAWVTRKMKTLSAMLIGMVAVTIGLLIAGLTMNVYILAFGIVFFSLGEMTVGPKKSEFLSLIAPPGKKALYLGYLNIPAGLGIMGGAALSGYLYGNLGEKAMLAQRYLAEKTNILAGTGKTWDGDVSMLEEVTGVSRPEAFETLKTVLGKSTQEVNELLWNTYDPQYSLWLPFAAIGIVSGIALFIYSRMARRWEDMNV
ncbi:MAG: MFS transporter [Puniceicoccales bacterium]|jgi:MFS family permease|nr:MFS transporter [Puniceicoccales bacterium]